MWECVLRKLSFNAIILFVKSIPMHTMRYNEMTVTVEYGSF